ncbi:putative serine/threonine-protein kinase YKL116C, predicted [Plasmopara halstedii]
MKRRVGSDGWKQVGAYEKHTEIGRGTYGTVYLGYHRESQRRVAIKKILGLQKTGRYEANILAQCQGAKHVVQLLDVVERDDKLYLVLEYMDSDLEALIGATESVPMLDIAQVKAYLNMLLLGVHELHTRGILHRDLKPNNLLLSKTQNCAKITDFGMATFITTQDENGKIDKEKIANDDKKQKRSVQVVTRAYRAPEIFFGEDEYGFEVDMWSVGCIFAEMLLRRPLADGSSDIDQLSKIFAVLGSPNENGWHDARELPFYLRFQDTNPVPLVEQFSMLSAAGVDLLSQMLELNPKKRISANTALQHSFFQEEPKLASSTDLVMVDSVEPHLVDTTNALDTNRAVIIKGRRLM